MIVLKKRRPNRANQNAGLSGAVFAAFCVTVAIGSPTGASAQDPMPLVSPLKPVTTPADSVPLPVIEDPAAEGFEELIVELRAGQEATRSEFAFARDGRIWVPVLPVFDLVELHAEIDSTGILSSMLAPDRLGLNMYPRAREVWRGNHYRLTQEQDLFFYEGRMYAPAVDVAWILGVQLYEDFTEMAVIFDGIGELPLGRRLHRERMRRIEKLYGDEPDVMYEAEHLPWSGATLDWGFTTPSFGSLELTNYDVGFGGAAFGGAMDARYRGRLDGGGAEELDARWQGVWPEQKWLRQLEVGGTRGTGPRSRAIDGISVSNSPFLRSSQFGETVLRGQLEPGWEVEIYRDGRLLAWDRVDDRGTWEFVVPIDYGQNPIEVRAYGPNGQLQITEHAVRVDFDRIPEGDLEYGISAGRTQFRDATGTANADLRYGINRNWTARAGYEGYKMSKGADLHNPYLSITGSVLNPLRVGAERVVGGWWWGAASLENSSDFRLGLQHFRYDGQGASSILVNPGDRERSVLDFFWRPWRQRRGFFLDFDAERVLTSFDRRTRTTVGVTTIIRGVRASAQLKESIDQIEAVSWRSSALAMQASVVLRSATYAWWSGTQVRLQSEVDTRYGQNDWIQLQLGRRVGRNARIEIGGGWFRLTNSAQLTVSLSSTGTHAYVNAGMIASDSSGSSTRLSAEGSLLYNPGQGTLSTFPLRSLGRGGLSGTMFVDANGNGLFDSGETTVPGARIIAGSLVAETDEFGRYSIWNLVAFEAADIQVDVASLRNPMWIPVFDLAAVAVSPNGFRRIDLPLVEAVEVEGRLLTRLGTALLCPGSVPLKLVQVDGDREYKTRCFSDGEFYLMGVVPGTYTIEPDPGWLAARGLKIAEDSSNLLVVEVGAGVVEFELIFEPVS